MDWLLKIAVSVFWVCLSVALVLGLCATWGFLDFGETTWRVLATAVIISIWAGFYIALRDALQRIKDGRDRLNDEKNRTKSLERTTGSDERQG